MSNKPPLGLRPRWLALEERQREIRDAIKRYDEQAVICPDEWLIELQDIERELAVLVPRPKPQPKQVDAEFTPPAAKIPEPISTGAAPFYVLVVSDDHPSVGGQPIVWEHPVLSETTLSAVLRRRAGLGSKYGTTFIAECRIIPELTRQ